jgi:hypothetical protein
MVIELMKKVKDAVKGMAKGNKPILVVGYQNSNLGSLKRRDVEIGIYSSHNDKKLEIICAAGKKETFLWDNIYDVWPLKNLDAVGIIRKFIETHEQRKEDLLAEIREIDFLLSEVFKEE